MSYFPRPKHTRRCSDAATAAFQNVPHIVSRLAAFWLIHPTSVMSTGSKRGQPRVNNQPTFTPWVEKAHSLLGQCFRCIHKATSPYFYRPLVGIVDDTASIAHLLCVSTKHSKWWHHFVRHPRRPPPNDTPRPNSSDSGLRAR
jgi:hypothetical protein